MISETTDTMLPNGIVLWVAHFFDGTRYYTTKKRFSNYNSIVSDSIFLKNVFKDVSAKENVNFSRHVERRVC